MWLALPFLAALLPGASAATRQRAIMSVNITMKSETLSRKNVLALSGPAWCDALLELALCERGDLMPLPLGPCAKDSAADDGPGSGGVGEWETVYRFGEVAVSAPTSEERSISEELALDVVGCVMSESMTARPRGWMLWQGLLGALERAARQRIGLSRGGAAWFRSTLCKLAGTVLQRVCRGGGRWTELTLDGLDKLVILVEERLFPPHQDPSPRGGGRRDSGGGAGALRIHAFDECAILDPTQLQLVDCLLETSRGMRAVLSPEAHSAGGLMARAQGALRPTLRVLLRALQLGGLNTDLAKGVSHEVFSVVHALLALPSTDGAVGREIVLEALLGLRGAIAGCNSAIKNGRGAGFDADFAAQSMEKKDFLCAVVLGAVQDLGDSRGDAARAGNVPGTPDSAPPPTAARLAVVEMLRPVYDMDVEAIFETLRPQLTETPGEASTEHFDMVPLYMDAGDAMGLAEGGDFSNQYSGGYSMPYGTPPPPPPSQTTSSTAAPPGHRRALSITTEEGVGGGAGDVPCGSLLFGPQGPAGVERWVSLRLNRHRDRVEGERLRLGHAMAALDASADRCWRHWRRVSRQAEGELLPLPPSGDQGSLSGNITSSTGNVLTRTGSSMANAAQGGGRLTGMFHGCQWKLGNNEHEGHEPGRIRAVLEPVLEGRGRAPVGGSKKSRAEVLSPPGAAARGISTEALGAQLARKCSQYIVDMTKSDNRAEGDEPEEEALEDAGEAWGLVGEVPPLGIGEAAGEEAVFGEGDGDSLTGEAGLGIVGEVASRGRSPSEERRAQEAEEAMVREAQDAIIGGVDPSVMQAAGPPVNVGPGARPPPEKGAPADPNSGASEMATLVAPKGNRRGRLVITRKNIMFVAVKGKGGDGSPDDDSAAVGGIKGVAAGSKSYYWPMVQVCGVYPRWYRLRDSALEIFFSRGKRRSIFLNFGTSQEDIERRDEVKRLLGRLLPRGTVRHGPGEARRLREAWQDRKIGNFDYLMGLNTLAGRTYNDLCQYPVMPWVLSVYDKPELDLSNPEHYRDLSKPMGALNEGRLQEFLDRFQSFQDPDIPAFMYGSHYSTAVGVVLHYLVRLQPFADLHRGMQNNQFDVADRLFSSIPRSWQMCTEALSEVKELTPEWYCLPEFLRNVNRFDLGTTQDGDRVGDVALPAWASSAEDFILKHRAALESELVSQSLHRWVDLIFGYQQKGQAAVQASNVFYYLTYYGAVDLTQISDESLRRATELQIAHFGQCPKQLFTKPHPQRGGARGVPRPVSMALSDLDAWREDSARSGAVKTLVKIPALGRNDVAVRCTRVLPNGKLFTVNGLGLLEMYQYVWKDAPPNLTRPPQGEAPDAVGVLQQGPSPVGGLNGEGQAPEGDGPGGSPGGVRSQQPLSGLEVERVLAPFDVLPRIPLPAEDHSGPRRRARGLQLPPAPVAFSSQGRFLFSGGSPSGAVMVWQVDTDKGEVVGEAALHGHSAAVTCLAAGGLDSTGQELLLTGSADCTAMVWYLRRLGSAFYRPAMGRCPTRVLRGHCGPVVSCALSDSLGVTLTCSAGSALLHSLDGDALLRALGPPSSAPLGGGDRGLHHTACALSAKGFALLAVERGSPRGGSAQEVEVYGINGPLIARSGPLPRAVRTMDPLGGGELVMLGGDQLLLEVRRVVDLSVLWALDPASWDVPPAVGPAGGEASQPLGLPQVACVELGPDPEAPILLCVGMAEGSLVVQALPDAEQWLRYTMYTKVGSLINAPAKLVKGTLQTATTFASQTFRGVSGMAQTGGGIAKELFGESKTIYKGMQRAGLVKGLVGYFKGPPGSPQREEHDDYSRSPPRGGRTPA